MGNGPPTAFRWVGHLRLHENGGPHPCGTNVVWLTETRLINISTNKANNTGPAFRHPPSSSPEAGVGPCLRASRAASGRAMGPAEWRKPLARLVARLAAQRNEPGANPLHRRSIGKGDKDRVVAGDAAHDLRPSSPIQSCGNGMG